MDSDREDDNHGQSAPPSQEATEPLETVEASEPRRSVTMSPSIEPEASCENDRAPEVEGKTSPEAGKRKHASTPDALDHERAKEIVQTRHNANNRTRESSIASVMPPPLSMPTTGALQYKPKSQVVFRSNGQGPEMVFSKQDVNQVNFYVAHSINTGDRFVAVIEPTDEGLNGLIQTIKEEIGAPDGQKRIVVSFATVKDNYDPPISAEIPNVRHARPPFAHSQAPLQSITRPRSERDQSMARIAQRATGLSRPIFSFGPSGSPRPRRPLPSMPVTRPGQFGVGSHVGLRFGTFQTHRRNLGSRNRRIPSNVRSRLAAPPQGVSATSSVAFGRTGPTPAPAPSVTRRADEESDDVFITRVEPRVRPFATPQPTGPPLKPTSLLSPGSDALTPNSSDRFILARLQQQWPYPNQLGSRLSAIGSFVIIHRNILRHLHDPNAGTLEENVYSLRSLFTGRERRLWNYLWLEMDTPDSDSKLALREETTGLVDDIASMLNIHDREEFTFERLSVDDGMLRALWTTDRLRFYQPHYMYQYPIIGDSWSGWERLPVDQEILNRPARIEWDGTGRISDKFRDLFDVRHEAGGSTPSKIKYCCAMPAVIEVHLTAAPAGVPPGKRILEALGEFYLWDWDTTALVGDDDFAAGNSTPKLEGMYQLMGVVRLRKRRNPDERDMVRIYTWGKKCVVPETQNCFWPAEWTLAEPRRQFRLYYVKIEDKSIGSGWEEEYPGQFRGREQ